MIKRPIGIFGGTFDPIHLGHLKVATVVYQQLNLEQLRFIPCNQSPHKKQPIAAPKHRIKMVELAIRDHEGYVLDDREIKRGGISYTVETLGSLRVEYPVTPLCLIMAKDAFAKFDSWHRWHEIIDLAHLIIADRPNSPKNLSDTLNAIIKTNTITKPEKLATKLASHIYFITTGQLPISATAIRADRKANQDISHLVANEVNRYIIRNELYSSNVCDK